MSSQRLEGRIATYCRIDRHPECWNAACGCVCHKKSADKLTFGQAQQLLNNQNPDKVIAAMTEWHPTILAEMLKAVTEARYIRYHSSHPDWTAAVREVAEKAGFDV